ncbi:hypothetical protein GCM10009836_03440 [Pseudonocardia ailaonensis]|uniref:DUF4397 domain-containing protein n=2 Tax=Pseudonocardia ailaonensis TaxID=367279 RepID=A0ABN2MJR4_9PSEU
MRRILTGALLVLTAALGAVLAAAPAEAATGTYLRLAHLSPDTPAVDISVTSFTGQTLQLDGVGYGNVSSYRRIEPGTYTIQMRPTGNPDSPPIVSGTLDAGAGGAYTAAALGPRSGLSVRLLADDLTRPPAHSARVRVVQGAQSAGAVAVTWNAAPVLGSVAFGTATGYVDVPTGSGTLGLAPSAGAPVQASVRFDDGGVYSVLVVQGPGGLEAKVETDALGVGDAPVGGVETGLGGTAPSSPGPVVPLAVLAVAGAGAGIALRIRRRVR